MFDFWPSSQCFAHIAGLVMLRTWRGLLFSRAELIICGRYCFYKYFFFWSIKVAMKSGIQSVLTEAVSTDFIIFTFKAEVVFNKTGLSTDWIIECVYVFRVEKWPSLVFLSLLSCKSYETGAPGTERLRAELYLQRWRWWGNTERLL